MMKVFRSIDALQSYLSPLKEEGKEIGFVATMGALHSGHLALIGHSSANNDLSICSIFVNPTQFNEKEDFTKYPRDEAGDIAQLETSSCDICFIPSVKDIYPDDNAKSTDYEDEDRELFNRYEGEFRPGHFKGVVNVVMRLFDATLCDRAYFGLKDYQQYHIIKRAAAHFNKEVDVIGVPTVRNEKGLALSSRNRRLSEEGLHKAAQVYEALNSIRESKGAKSADEAVKNAKNKLVESGFVVEYLDLCNNNDLKPIRQWSEAQRYIVLAAVRLEGVRLIDNLQF